MNWKYIEPGQNYRYYRCASWLFLFSLFFPSLSPHVSLCLSLFSSDSLITRLHVVVGVCVVVVVVWLCVVVCGCVCVSSCPCTSKSFRVYVQNAPVCTFKTPASRWTRAFWTFTRKRLNVRTEASLCLSFRLTLFSHVSISSHTSLFSLSLSLSTLSRQLFQ